MSYLENINNDFKLSEKDWWIDYIVHTSDNQKENLTDGIISNTYYVSGATYDKIVTDSLTYTELPWAYDKQPTWVNTNNDFFNVPRPYRDEYKEPEINSNEYKSFPKPLRVLTEEEYEKLFNDTPRYFREPYPFHVMGTKKIAHITIEDHEKLLMENKRLKELLKDYIKEKAIEI